jgi:hypothetical protein
VSRFPCARNAEASPFVSVTVAFLVREEMWNAEKLAEARADTTFLCARETRNAEGPGGAATGVPSFRRCSDPRPPGGKGPQGGLIISPTATLAVTRPAILTRDLRKLGSGNPEPLNCFYDFSQYVATPWLRDVPIRMTMISSVDVFIGFG